MLYKIKLYTNVHLHLILNYPNFRTGMEKTQFVHGIGKHRYEIFTQKF